MLKIKLSKSSGPEQESLQEEPAATAASTLSILGLAVVYLTVSIIVGETLAIAPGYVSPIWPAAGIAFAALLIWGVKLWPGIWFGSLVLNYWLDSSATGAIMAVIIASGSSLQAYLGVCLTQSLFKNTAPFTMGKNVLLFLALAGPFSCVISASVGISTLYGFGVVPIDLLLNQWLAWWSGDTLGVILFAPIMLLVFQQPAGVSKSIIVRMTLPLVMTAVILAVGHFLFDKVEENNAKKAVLKEMQYSLSTLSVQLNLILNSTEAVELFFDSSVDVDQREFAIFSIILEGYPAVIAVDWAPLILVSERWEFEQKAQRTVGPGYQIRSLGYESPLLVPFDFFPVLYSMPDSQYALARGLDHGSSADRRVAINRAIETGEIQAVIGSHALTRLPVTSPVLVFQPTYHRNINAGPNSAKIRRKNLKGIIVCILDPSVLFASLESGPRKLNYRISDISDISDTKNPVTVFGSLPSAAVPLLTETLNFAGRLWQVELDLVDEYWHPVSTLQSRLYLLFSLVAAYLIAFSVLASAGRNAAAEVLVAARTRELADARDDAVKANAAKSSFLATVSHEIRTPMNGVVGMLEILWGTQLTESQQKLISTARYSADNLMSIIDDILDFSKLESGMMTMERAPVSIRRLSDQIISSLSTIAAKKSVDLTQCIASDIPDFIMSDEVRLRQVLLNLVGNAIKFSAGNTDRRGEVEINIQISRVGADRLVIAVKDNGVGMTTEAQTRIFKPFVQAEMSTTRRFGGTGLGLAICQRIVDQWRGKIEVTSTPGQGSCFTVMLALETVQDQFTGDETHAGRDISAAAVPLTGKLKFAAQLATRLSAPVAPGMADAGAMGRLILVAEDDETNQAVIQLQLDSLGYTCEIAENGVKALALWRSGRYALLLTDLFMPEMDGYELAATIRKEERGAQIPIFVLSANVMREEIEQAKVHGVNGYLTKPVSLYQLQALLAQWLPSAVVAHDIKSDTDRPAKSDSEVFDVAVLKELVGDSPAAVVDLLGDFLLSLASRRTDLSEACILGAPASVAAIAHKLKAASRSVGALALAALSAELEMLGNSGSKEQITLLLPKIITAISLVEKEISNYLNTAKAEETNEYPSD